MADIGGPIGGALRWIFWGAAAVVAYTYLGYPAWLWIRSRWRPRPIQLSPLFPSVSIVMVVRNEASVLDRKLQNLLQLNYSSDREIVVVSDGSTDGTNSILSEFAKVSGARIVLSQPSQGKAAVLNEAMKIASGEIVVFTDARQQIEPDAVRLLMENFADPSVGCASGELMLGEPETGEATQGTGLYWRIEKAVREMEAISGSTVGATGALYAVRRELVVPLPAETILDDVYIPMHVVRQGARVVFDPRARAWDKPNLGTEREFQRKVRTLNGNYQLVQLAPWLLTPANPIWFEFVSHKLMRLFVPLALAAALVTAMMLPDPIYRIALIAQLVFYGLGASAWVLPKRVPLARVADAAFTFVMLNTAAVVAFTSFISGRKAVWNR